MQYQTVTYMKRKNMGNYEHEEVSISAMVEEGDDHFQVIAQLKLTCHQALNMVITPAAPEAKEEVKDEKPKKTAKVTKKTTKKKATSKPKVEKDESSEEEVSEEDNTTKYELKDVKQALAEVWKSKGQGIAKQILAKKFKVSRTDELDPKDYAAVIEECNVCLK